MFPDVLEIELGSSCGGKSSDCTHEVASFGYRFDYDHDGVFSVRFWSSIMKSTLVVSQGAFGIGRV